MDTKRSEVIVYPPPEDGPPYALVAGGESDAAAEAVPIPAGQEKGAPPPNSGKDPAAGMVPERRTEHWRKSA